MAYVLLGIAILAEVVATSLIKSTAGFSRLWPTVACLGGYALAFLLLAQAVKEIPVGVAYALWSGLGTAAIVAIGAVFLGESVGLAKLTGIALIIAGVVVVNLAGEH
ncbi:Quaternary ammonium compound-resistance protein SugE [Micromonospora saelicesensis]|uniref:Small multidrug resistance pump n=2 Tax=Micromonospora TaxID=1873 RepID=A0ABS0JJ05_9ACTN|nr:MULTISPECIES: multidrug efflux SMR transporter [Micromonospora]MBG6067056.1 small multidrug resistance pump [Micromonospora ureilytica]MBQ1016541.1 multidrug efflux SMR transporter [Micromonospora sp. D93]RAN91930.1 Quaternary ammonium compound-resistance protein SugE [Micromonospora saelicesensis]RAO48638.1 Quaternary ammonium compound-resistance protein SugE [Micromonospora saelicesensis]RAO60913.1 Quaternary ammonium compound-resistance protein SugE [Micromonospora saelicesensis]